MKNTVLKKYGISVLVGYIIALSGVLHAQDGTMRHVQNRGPENIPGVDRQTNTVTQVPSQSSHMAVQKQKTFTGHGPALLNKNELPDVQKMQVVLLDANGIAALKEFAQALRIFNTGKKSTITYKQFIDAVQQLSRVSSKDGLLKAAIEGLRAALTDVSASPRGLHAGSIENIPLSVLLSNKKLMGHKGEYNPVATAQAQVKQENESAGIAQFALAREQVRLLKATLWYLDQVIHYYKMVYAVENEQEIYQAMRDIFKELKILGSHFSDNQHRVNKNKQQKPGGKQVDNQRQPVERKQKQNK